MKTDGCIGVSPSKRASRSTAASSSLRFCSPSSRVRRSAASRCSADVRRPSYVYGHNAATVIVQVLKQAGNDLSRENIMRQATNLRDLEVPMLLPGIKVNTSPTDYYAVQQLQLMRFDGKRWVRFGDLVYDE